MWLAGVRRARAACAAKGDHDPVRCLNRIRDVHIQPVKGALQRPDPFHQRGDGQLGPVYHPRVCAYRADGRRGVVAGRDGHTPPGVIAGEIIALAGAIGRRVRDNLLPGRGCGSASGPSSGRCPAMPASALRVDRRTCKATLSIDIVTIPLRP